MVQERILFEIQERLRPKVEPDFHMKGLLERDQRTVLNRSESKLLKHNAKVSKQTRRRNRLGQALALGACLLSIVRFPSVMSSPTRRSVYEHEMFWVNPCGGVRNTDYESSPDYAKGTTSIAEVLDTIILPANLSLTQAQLFRDEYVWKTFEHDFSTQQEMWSFQRVNFDWLPTKEQVPKELGEHLSYEYLESLKIDDILLDTYHFLQRMAVGLEQVVADQIENNGDFIEKFDSVKNQLRSLLCEYHSTIEERKLSMRPDVTREIMNKEMRNDKNDTNRKMRDWVIFRDYMNLLEYIIEVFEYFKKNPAKLGPS